MIDISYYMYYNIIKLRDNILKEDKDMNITEIKEEVKNSERFTKEVKDILMSRFMDEITFIEAHNQLIPLGIMLSEDGVVSLY